MFQPVSKCRRVFPTGCVKPAPKSKVKRGTSCALNAPPNSRPKQDVKAILFMVNLYRLRPWQLLSRFVRGNESGGEASNVCTDRSLELANSWSTVGIGGIHARLPCS